MRRSSMIRLTVLPLLASASLARAQSAPGADPLPFGPPGATAPMLSPPGMTPAVAPVRCGPDDPERDKCGTGGHGFVHVYGGFGHYFSVGGG